MCEPESSKKGTCIKCGKIILDPEKTDLCQECEKKFIEKYLITSKITVDDKPHDKFELAIKMESEPAILNIKASNTTVTTQKLKRNPAKMSFGKIEFANYTVEAFTYDRMKKQDVYWSFLKRPFAKSDLLHEDVRRAHEFLVLKMRTSYFLSLSVERRKKYVRNHLGNANINIRRNKHA